METCSDHRGRGRGRSKSKDFRGRNKTNPLPVIDGPHFRFRRRGGDGEGRGGGVDRSVWVVGPRGRQWGVGRVNGDPETQPVGEARRCGGDI